MSAYVTLIGAVGKEAEIRKGREDKKFVSFKLVVRNGKGQDGVWYRVATGNVKLQPHIRLKRLLQVRGRLDARLNVSGGTPYMNLDVYADSIEFLDKPAEASETSEASSTPSEEEGPSGPAASEGSDDIPF